MSEDALTGERLKDDHALYGADLARHRAAYLFAGQQLRGRRVLDLGCGTGYGSAELAALAGAVVGLDRVAPAARARRSGVAFLRADLAAVPLAPAAFDAVVSFQVIEHLSDPTAYLAAMARSLRPDGVALVSTPNLLESDRENPYHVHEYEATELSALLARHFGAVEMLGVGAIGPARRYHQARLRRIRQITRLDLLDLRRRLPSGLVEWLFARLSLVVRLVIRGGGGADEVTTDHFPIGPVDPSCLDLLAVCRAPRSGAAPISR